VKNVDETILPLFSTSVGTSISPRVLPSYAILYWFSLQVSNSSTYNDYYLISVSTPSHSGRLKQ
jgi:hypothetical protein